MKIINKEFVNKMKQINSEYTLELSDYECECYSNMFHILNEVVDNQFTFEQLFGAYNFFTDVLNGKRPDVDLFSYDEAYKGFYRLSKGYSTTKSLKEEQRVHFCFVIYLASCIMIMDKNEQEQKWNMECFEKGAKSIIKEYKYSLEQFPDKFLIKNYSNPTQDDYGYTPENPIEVTSISMQYQYLAAIETISGKQITFQRVCSLQGKDDIFIDKYDIYVKKILMKKKIATLYLTGDGFDNSISTPKGFRFIE